MNIDIVDVMSSLATHRPIYHSEADFQHAFAWELHLRDSDLKLRLEKTLFVDDKRYQVDLVASKGGSSTYFEMKYKTAGFQDYYNESFDLKNHGAEDQGRYDFLYDLQRLEAITKSKGGRGYAIFLTNESKYWKEPKIKKHLIVCSGLTRIEKLQENSDGKMGLLLEQ